MKEIKAFIRPGKAKEVHQELRVNGYCCMTLTECEGTGVYTDPHKDFPSFKFPFMHSKVVKMEVVCTDKDCRAIIDIIREKGRTGNPGDGIIYISEVEQVYRVKNNQTGIKAIQKYT